MAAAEARAAWQRAANRYFVQEDAKRAPKLACCPPSTLSSKQTDIGPNNVDNGPDHRSVGFMPSNRTPYSNLPPDAKWWLQMEPNYGLHRCLNFEEFKSKTGDKETCPPMTSSVGSTVREVAAMSEESIRNVDHEDLESFLDVKKSAGPKLEDLSVEKHDKSDQDFLDIKNVTDYYETFEMEMVESSISKRKSEFCSSEDSWIGGEKAPWWRMTDGEELAQFVGQKSLHHIENCDLPPPRELHVRREPYIQVSSVHHDEILLSSIDWEAQSDSISSPSSGGSQRKHWSSLKEGLLHNENAVTESLRLSIVGGVFLSTNRIVPNTYLEHVSDSSSELEISRTSSNGTPETGRSPVSDPCKAKLLEALCHSQTRAREAEKAAKQAYTEKEHLLKLFFRQASQLFAYKQWFKLLQLEALLYQTKECDPSPLTPFPDLLPWVPQKPRKLRKNWQKSAKAKQRKRDSEHDIGKYCVAFAVGFTLVGAGLILGWTVGWLLPAL